MTRALAHIDRCYGPQFHLGHIDRCYGPQFHLGHVDPNFGPAFHIGGNAGTCCGRPKVAVPSAPRPIAPTSPATNALMGLRDFFPAPTMRYAVPTPIRLSDFVTYKSKPVGVSDYVTTPPTAGYSQYGPQRIVGPVVRRNPRVGWVPGMADYVTFGDVEDRPDPKSTLATFKSTWINGEVTISKGEWGYLGPTDQYPHLGNTITMKIIDAYGQDGDVMVVFKVKGAPDDNPGFPTEEFPNGTNQGRLQDIASTGKWVKPGAVGKLAFKLGVTPFLLGGAAVVALGLAWWTRRQYQSNKCKRKNPYYGKVVAEPNNFLLGGVRSVTSSRFLTKDAAKRWVEVMSQQPNAAGGGVYYTKKKAEILM